MTSLPYTFALPESGFRIPRIIFIVVDLPEPFGPRSPSISPRRKAKVRWSTARVAPKDFAREFASSAYASPVEGVDKGVLSTAFPFRIRTFSESGVLSDYREISSLSKVGRWLTIHK